MGENLLAGPIPPTDFLQTCDRLLIEAHPEMLTQKVAEHYATGNFRAFSMTREAERIHAKLTSGS